MRVIAVQSLQVPARTTSAWTLRYGGAIAVLNLLWELLQLPLYTLWYEGDARQIVLAVLHCTAGDLLIAGLSLLAALALVRPNGWPRQHSVATSLLTLVLGLGYTVHSEWYNTTVTHLWAYSSHMPQIAGIGLSPIAQWLIIPCAAFWWAHRPSQRDPKR